MMKSDFVSLFPLIVSAISFLSALFFIAWKAETKTGTKPIDANRGDNKDTGFYMGKISCTIDQAENVHRQLKERMVYIDADPETIVAHAKEAPDIIVKTEENIEKNVNRALTEILKHIKNYIPRAIASGHTSIILTEGSRGYRTDSFNREEVERIVPLLEEALSNQGFTKIEIKPEPYYQEGEFKLQLHLEWKQPIIKRHEENQ